MGYYFCLPENYNIFVSCHVIFLEKEFIQDGDNGRKIELEEKVSEEYRVQEPKLSSKPVDVAPSPPHRSSKIFHPFKGCLDILIEDLEEAFLIGDKDTRNDLKIYDETMLDIDFEK